MRVVLAWTWLALVGAAFVTLMIFMLMQIPLEFWLFLGMVAGFGTFLAITGWAVKQIPGGDEE